MIPLNFTSAIHSCYFFQSRLSTFHSAYIINPCQIFRENNGKNATSFFHNLVYCCIKESEIIHLQLQNHFHLSLYLIVNILVIQVMFLFLVDDSTFNTAKLVGVRIHRLCCHNLKLPIDILSLVDLSFNLLCYGKLHVSCLYYYR